MKFIQTVLIGSILWGFFSCTQQAPLYTSLDTPPPFIPHLPLQPVSMASMEAWKDPGENWQLATRAYSDLATQHDLQTEAGTGVLVNLPSEAHRENLFSAWEHGDLELEVEVLMPKGSNSGIYLQSRYEIQLLDSWGKDTVQHADMGGIYQRWDPEREEGEQGFEGHAPMVNASRAPGLWQHIHALFRAPRFDENGEKIEPARFEWIYLNGVLVHEYVEVYGPTRAAAYEDEVPMAPLMIQGDHGPVAFRNLNTKKYGDQGISLGQLRYQVYDYDGDTRPVYDSLNLIQEGVSDSFNVAQISEKREHFAMKLSGEFEAPVAGTYLFQTLLDDGGDLYIDGEPVVENGGELEFEKVSGTVELTPGTHHIELTFFQVTWRAHATIFYEGPEIELQPLASIDPNAGRERPKPLVVEPGENPEMLRGFVNYRGEKRTHVLSVGDPAGLHYSYDLEEGALLSAWKGSFANVHEMWVNRGHSQLLQPMNASVELTSGVTLYILNEANALWPSFVPTDFNAIGYRLDKAYRPIFEYTFGEIKIRDQVIPDTVNQGLQRTLSLEALSPQEGAFLRLAQADDIEEMPDGSFRVDGTYYLKATGITTELKKLGDEVALLVPVLTSGINESISYSIIW